MSEVFPKEDGLQLYGQAGNQEDAPQEPASYDPICVCPYIGHGIGFGLLSGSPPPMNHPNPQLADVTGLAFTIPSDSIPTPSDLYPFAPDDLTLSFLNSEDPLLDLFPGFDAPLIDPGAIFLPTPPTKSSLGEDAILYLVKTRCR